MEYFLLNVLTAVIKGEGGDDDSKDIYYNHVDDVMNHKIGDDRLIDICTKFTVIERSL